MPVLLIDRQRRMTEVGRIRLGDKGAKGNPQRLEAFRLTSRDSSVLDAAAKLYGGTVRPWTGNPGQFELYTEVAEIPVLASPVETSQWFEHWTGGGCARRCDGQNCQVATANGLEERDCQCDPENRECKLTTRMSVMLPDLPSLGVWRLETHGYYAATELPEMFNILQQGAKSGQYIPATLAIEQREVKRAGKTKRFPVPVLRLRQALGDILPIAGRPAPALAGSAPPLPAPSRALPGPDQDVVAEQIGTYARHQTEAPAPPASSPEAREQGAWVAANLSKPEFESLKRECTARDLVWHEAVREAREVGCATYDQILNYLATGEAPEGYVGPTVTDEQGSLV